MFFLPLRRMNRAKSVELESENIGIASEFNNSGLHLDDDDNISNNSKDEGPVAFTKPEKARHQATRSRSFRSDKSAKSGKSKASLHLPLDINKVRKINYFQLSLDLLTKIHWHFLLQATTYP